VDMQVGVTSHVIIGRFEAGRYFRPELS
jgi:hypothetical protein